MSQLKQRFREILSTNNIEKDPFNAFLHAAKLLMNESFLKIDQNEYRVIECEFYYWSKNHQDCYIHDYTNGGNAEQKKFGTWYPHPSGIDLTFGNIDDATAGGILLRGSRRLDNNEILSGPINLRKPMLRDGDKNVMGSFGHLSEIEDAFDNSICCVVENNDHVVDKRILTSTRVGLPERKEDRNNEMKDREYRFIADFDSQQFKHPFKEKEYVAKRAYKRGCWTKQEINHWVGYRVFK